jgi:Lysozyme like domain
MWLAAGRWVLGLLFRDLLLEQGWQIVSTLGVSLVVVVLTLLWSLAIMAQPGGIYWLASQAPPELQAQRPLAPSLPTVGFIPTLPDIPLDGGVTDAQRFELAVGAGFGLEEGVIATAISIAENCTIRAPGAPGGCLGDPAAHSPPNFDGSVDLGLWQINSSHWAEFGGREALIRPTVNAHAAFVLRGRQGWCAWSTYGDVQTCGRGHTNSYLAFLARARIAAAGGGP